MTVDLRENVTAEKLALLEAEAVAVTLAGVKQARQEQIERCIRTMRDARVPVRLICKRVGKKFGIQPDTVRTVYLRRVAKKK